MEIKRVGRGRNGGGERGEGLEVGRGRDGGKVWRFKRELPHRLRRAIARSARFHSSSPGGSSCRVIHICWNLGGRFSVNSGDVMIW